MYNVRTNAVIMNFHSAGILRSEEEAESGDISTRVPSHNHRPVLLGVPEVPAR
jgi:hypothetical protein